MDITEDIFVNRLQALKADSPLRQFGVRIGVCEGTVRNYLQGKTKPKMGILQKISQEYNVSLEWLVGEEVHCSQKMDEDIVAETRPLYGEKLLHEEEKFAEIQVYIEEVRAGGPRAQGLFADKFIECFGDFKTWHREKYRAIKTNSRKKEE